MYKLLSLLLFSLLVLDADAQRSITASTPVGDLIGSVKDNVATFLGIPYARPPILTWRFKLPKTVRWNEPRNATKYANACFQCMRIDSIAPMRPGQIESEDCLYLDIYVDGETIDPQANMPVVIFIHGGGFTDGTSATYDYSNFVKGRGIVAVAIQYRLGLFGFAKSPDDEKIPGNLGLHDQVAAIKWVKEYINSFGGNPKSITLQGESAGSISVALHMLSPLSKGTFQRAIMQSGAPITMKPMNEKVLEKAMNDLIEYVHCTPVEAQDGDSYKCLKYVNAIYIKRFIDKAYSEGVIFYPSIDSRFFAGKDPIELEKLGKFESQLESVLVGHNGNEGGMFLTVFAPNTFPVEKTPLIQNMFKWQLKLVVPSVLKKYQPLMNYAIDRTYENKWVMSFTEVSNKMGKLLGDVLFICPNIDLTQSLLKYSPNTKLYYYHFQMRPTLKKKNYWPYIDEALHAEELQFTFGKPSHEPENYTGSEIQVSTEMMDDWAEFVKTGKVKNKNWVPATAEEFSHVAYESSTGMKSKSGFPENICKTLPWEFNGFPTPI